MVEDGRRLASMCPRLRGDLLLAGGMLDMGGSTRVRNANLGDADDVTLRGLCVAVQVLLSGSVCVTARDWARVRAAPVRLEAACADSQGDAATDAEVAAHAIRVEGIGGPPGKAALGSRAEEAQIVEDAICTFEVLAAAEALDMPGLAKAARDAVLRNGGFPELAFLMPLFVRACGRPRRGALASACLRLAAHVGTEELLRGRERQLGVLYATHPEPAAVLSGALTGLQRGRSKLLDKQSSLDPLVLELLLGPSGAHRLHDIGAHGLLKKE